MRSVDTVERTDENKFVILPCVTLSVGRSSGGVGSREWPCWELEIKMSRRLHDALGLWSQDTPSERPVHIPSGSPPIRTASTGTDASWRRSRRRGL